MSETYHIVKEIVKREFIEHIRKSVRKGRKNIGMMIGLLLLTCAYLFSLVKNTMFSNLVYIISVLIIIGSVLWDSKPKKNEEILSSQELIFQICQNLIDLELYSLEIVNSLQEEIVTNIEKKEQQINRFFKRISVIFVSIFWIPFGFLFKYLLDSNSEPLSWNNFIQISSYLLAITLMIIAILFSMNSIFDIVSRHEITYLRFIYSNLNDVKYMIISKRDIPKQEAVNSTL